jgi:ElaB/YqjD/DUF883 family membrane-anchored ribosome-binding protein
MEAHKLDELDLTSEDVREASTTVLQTADRWVRNNPVLATVAALAVGYLAARCLRSD